VIPHHGVTGDGPVVVLGSSLGATLSMWDGQLPLAERFRLVRYDHRGHGGSGTPPGPYELADLAGDVLELMDALGIERAHHVGLSLGAMVGMWLAAHAPERVDRLAVLCTSAQMGPPSLWQERAAKVLEAGSTEPIADPVVDRWLTPAFAAAHPEARDRLRAMLVAADPAGYAACCGAIERMDLRGDLPAIAAPTLVISGADDLATPVEHQRLIAQAIPGAHHEIVSPAAHVATVEQPEPVNRLIEEHLS
jgi:3-oxoadipate enol-lactonase